MRKSIALLALVIVIPFNAVCQQANFEKAMFGIAETLSKSYAAGSDRLFKLTVAVSDFSENSDLSRNLQMGEAVRDVMLLVLGRSQLFTVVDRRNLDKTLEELELQHSDLTDQATAARLGMLLNAEAIMYGSITEQAEDFLVTVQLVKVETGETVTASAALPKALFIKVAEDRLDMLYVQPMGIGIAVSGLGQTFNGDRPGFNALPIKANKDTFLRRNLGIEIRYRITSFLMAGLGFTWLYGQMKQYDSISWDMPGAGIYVPDTGSAPFRINAEGFSIPVSLYGVWTPVRWFSLLLKLGAEYCVFNYEGVFDPSNGYGFGLNDYGPTLHSEFFLFNVETGFEYFVTPRMALSLMGGFNFGSTQLEHSMSHLTDLPLVIPITVTGAMAGAKIIVYF
jgi:TolB-like protein